MIDRSRTANDELLLASARVRPAVLERTGFAFAGRDLDAALAGMLRKGRDA